MSSIISEDAAPGGFRLGRVFSIAASAVRLQWLPMLLFSLLLACAPTAISNTQTTKVTINLDFPPGVQPPIGIQAAQQASVRKETGATSPMLGFGVGAGLFVLGSALGVALTSLTLASRAHPAGAWRGALRLCLRDTLPLAGLTIVTAALTTAGYFLFIVPGTILTAAWCLSFPVRVAEHTGLVATLRRSAELTRGHRWAVFGLLLGWATIYIGLLFSSVLLTSGETNPVRNYLISPAFGAVASLVINVMIAALYLELRRVHDGIAMESVDAVFA